MLVIIRGNACSGKSTIAERLRTSFKNPKRVAVIHTTIFYWEIVHGDTKKMVMENTKDILNNYLKNKYDVILEGTLSDKNKKGNLYVSDFLKLAKKYKVPSKEFFFEADFSELKKREKNRKKISLKRLKEFYDKTNKTKKGDEIIIDTSKKSINKVLREVRGHLVIK